MDHETRGRDNYYNSQAADYMKKTLLIDMSDLYAEFLPHIPQKGKILDAGCGSGRDALFFKNKGYDITAMDSASEMVKESSKIIGQPTRHLKFQDMTFEGEFDGIWACASLLHVPNKDLLGIFKKLCNALKVEGVLFFSFKHGEGETGAAEGRLFNNQTFASLRALLKMIPEFEEVKLWTTINDGSSSLSMLWLNGLLKKQTNAGIL